MPPRCWSTGGARCCGGPSSRPGSWPGPVPPAGDEQAMVLWQAVQALPPRQRAVLVLRFHEDLPEAEVARLLGLPLGTVKSLAHRGLARLRAELGSPAMEE